MTALAQARRHASIRCRCGVVGLKFPTAQPVHSYECCCVDCFDKNVWSCRAGGVPLPQGRGPHGTGTPLDLRYFPNRLVVTSGQEKLAFNRLREGSASTNMICRECKSLLCVDHPRYDTNVVLMFPEYCPLIGADPLPRPMMRVHVKDWPRDEMVSLEPLPGTWYEDGQRRVTIPWRCSSLVKYVLGSQQAARAFGTPPAPEMPGVSFQSLRDEAGAVDVLGLPEGTNSARSGASQLFT